jgi:hypothetical protein
MSPSVIKVCHMFGFSGVQGYVGVKGAGNGMGMVGMRQFILSIGLVWMGVCICAHRATTPTTVRGSY